MGRQPGEQLDVDVADRRREVAARAQEGGAHGRREVVDVALQGPGAVPDARVDGHQQRHVEGHADRPHDQRAQLVAQALEEGVTKHGPLLPRADGLGLPPRPRRPRRVGLVGLAVERHEDVLQVRLAAREVEHRVLAQLLDDRVQRAGDGEAERRRALAVDRHAGDAGDVFELRRRHRRGEHDLELAHRPARQAGDVLERDELALADEGDAVADALHLGQHVRREEHRLPGVARLVDERVELVLHQRVEARGGLVEDEQLRPVHERLDEAELALVAGREVGRPCASGRSRAARRARHDVASRRRRAGWRGSAASRAPVSVGVQGELAGEVADCAPDRHASRGGCRGPARGRAPMSGG